MSHTHSWCLYHIVFATKGRRPLIPHDTLSRLWAYIGGIARAEKMCAFAIGGTENHIHLLLTIPPSMSLAKAVQILKACSSKWLNEVVFRTRRFGWQEGYGAFSVGVRQLEAVQKYIATQEEHHRGHTFEEEFESFLAAHGLTRVTDGGVRPVVPGGTSMT